MQTAEIIETSDGQTVRLPTNIRVESKRVWVRRQGEALVLEPVKSGSWPEGFFDAIRIDDVAFVRPEQGRMPPAPDLNRA